MTPQATDRALLYISVQIGHVGNSGIEGGSIIDDRDIDCGTIDDRPDLDLVPRFPAKAVEHHVRHQFLRAQHEVRTVLGRPRLRAEPLDGFVDARYFGDPAVDKKMEANIFHPLMIA